MELRTDYEKADKSGDSGSSFDKYIDKYISNVQKNPTMKLRLLSMASESGIDPVLLAPLLDLSEEDMQALQQAQQQQVQQQQVQEQPTEQTPETRQDTMPKQPEPKEMEPDELLNFMDQIIDFTDEEMTLGELREFGENNPDVLETAISIAF